MITKLPEFSSLIKYKANDVCLYNGRFYVALNDSPITLPTNTTINWR